MVLCGKLWYCVSNCDILWQIVSKLKYFKEKNILNCISCYLLHHYIVCISSMHCDVLSINKYIYVYINMYLDITYSSGLSVWNSQWTNSATHSDPLQQLVTMNCDEPPSPTFCHPFLLFESPTSFQKPCAVCVSWLVFAYIQFSLLKVSEEKKNLIFIKMGKVNFIILAEWQKESYKCLRWSDISSTISLKLFLPYHLPAQLFLITSIYQSGSLSRHCS